jgi:23S rRNA (adenine2503-C2)-methyltransferase
MNLTIRAFQNGLVDESDPRSQLALKANEFRNVGYEVIESIGELEENAIGSNCGQYLAGLEAADANVGNGYSYSAVNV